MRLAVLLLVLAIGIFTWMRFVPGEVKETAYKLIRSFVFPLLIAIGLIAALVGLSLSFNMRIF